jgi:hypothetical protein
MSHLFKILPNNFFQILSSPNKDIYIDCLLLLESIANKENNICIEKDLAIHILEKYFNEKNKKLLTEEKENSEELGKTVIDNRQKASRVIYIFKKNGWLGEEKINYNTVNLNFFDYSLEMINFFKKTLNKIKLESIGNIYSVYSLLKFFLVERNYANFHEAVSKTQNLLVKLKILKAHIYRFYYQLLNTDFQLNVQNILEQLLLNYKKNFFDSSYYLLKTEDNFFKYRRQINLFLEKITKKSLYTNALSKQIQYMYNYSEKQSYSMIFEQIEQIKANLKTADQLIELIDQKNEQYLQIACDRILFFNNKKENLHNILNYGLQMILNNQIEYRDFFHLYPMKNLDQESFYKPRRMKQEVVISCLEHISEESENILIQKKKDFLNKDFFYNKKNINLYVEELLNHKNPFKGSEMVLNNNRDISRLILIFIYSKSSVKKNIYHIQPLNKKVICNNISFSDFLIFKNK